jgi:hypothetical protein
MLRVALRSSTGSWGTVMACRSTTQKKVSGQAMGPTSTTTAAAAAAAAAAGTRHSNQQLHDTIQLVGCQGYKGADGSAITRTRRQRTGQGSNALDAACSLQTAFPCEGANMCGLASF